MDPVWSDQHVLKQLMCKSIDIRTDDEIQRNMTTYDEIIRNMSNVTRPVGLIGLAHKFCHCMFTQFYPRSKLFQACCLWMSLEGEAATLLLLRRICGWRSCELRKICGTLPQRALSWGRWHRWHRRWGQCKAWRFGASSRASRRQLLRSRSLCPHNQEVQHIGKSVCLQHTWKLWVYDKVYDKFVDVRSIS